MKQLSIEEKAKRYDEALKKVKDMLSYKEVRREDMEYLFPALKESEDESWISKEIIKYLKEKGDFRSCWIAWLEKQSTPQVRTGLEWVNTIDDACDKRYLEEYAHGEYCHEQSFKWGFQEGVDWLEKQGEQKPEWSEEDEKCLANTIHILEGVASGAVGEFEKSTIICINWLKSLKDRVQPQNCHKSYKRIKPITTV